MSRPSLKDPRILIATWMGSGYLKPAPGTWGTLAGLVSMVPLAIYAPVNLIPFLIIPLYFLGAYCADVMCQAMDKHDASEIVIDEVVGIMIPLCFFPVTALNCALAFILFRIFDIFKPWPVSFFDQKVHNGHGIMLDDVVAGIFAALAQYLILLVIA